MPTPVPLRPAATHLLRGAATTSSSLPLPPIKPSAPAPATVHLTPLEPGVLSAKALSAAHFRVYDPGFAHTLSCTSAITFIDGSAGVLRHRGHSIELLASHASFLELTYLLIYGSLPSAPQLARWRSALYAPAVAHLHADVRAVVAAFPRSAHPMPILIAGLAALGASLPHLNPSLAGAAVYDDPRAREDALLRALAAMPALCAGVYRHSVGLSPAFLDLPTGEGATDMTYAQRFLALLGGNVHPTFAKALDLLLLLHADHEQNCSTATVRQLSSSGVDVFSALSGGVAALYGPLHGGATEAVLKMLVRIGSVRNIPAFLDRVKQKKERLMGFGHRVYRNYDPRARIIRDVAYEVFDEVGAREPLIEVAAALEKAALADDFFVSRKLFPNCDFYSGLLYKAMGFPSEYFPVLFALGRCSGWMAHWLEFLDDPDRRIARPHQRYVGPAGPIPVPPLAERTDADKGPSEDAVRESIMVAKL